MSERKIYTLNNQIQTRPKTQVICKKKENVEKKEINVMIISYVNQSKCTIMEYYTKGTIVQKKKKKHSIVTLYIHYKYRLYIMYVRKC